MLIDIVFYPPPYGRSVLVGTFEVDKESDADDLCEMYSNQFKEEMNWVEVVTTKELPEPVVKECM